MVFSYSGLFYSCENFSAQNIETTLFHIQCNIIVLYQRCYDVISTARIYIVAGGVFVLVPIRVGWMKVILYSFAGHVLCFLSGLDL